ncbi:hypothetical protein FNV43_RR23102 [Rhamnella rubrinervis]|uniref:Uncharacterized protein n=1 Tax=Rhamnella rubrinervis TaxID=2594499 RepID=A0A8K0DRP0_9ROSA|nr:hypothetical protein FNV43_RR23102 [Rhamnella rubrinervis]
MQQILQWLFKETHERATENCPGPTKPNQDQNIVVYKHSGVHRKSKSIEGSKLGSKKLKKIFPLCRTDIATACFYSTLNLKRPSDINRQQDWIKSMKMKKEDIARGLGININKIDMASTHAGNKVLPISEATLSANTNIEECSTSENKEKLKGDKGKTMSRMKELLRWAATAKSEKGAKFIGRKVLQLRNRRTLKSVPDDDQLSNESPKISFRWDVESCSTTSSAYSAISLASSTAVSMPSLYSTSIQIQDHGDHCTPRRGNWITTDSEFVVLEL